MAQTLPQAVEVGETTCQSPGKEGPPWDHGAEGSFPMFLMSSSILEPSVPHTESCAWLPYHEIGGSGMGLDEPTIYIKASQTPKWF